MSVKPIILTCVFALLNVATYPVAAEPVPIKPFLKTPSHVAIKVTDDAEILVPSNDEATINLVKQNCPQHSNDFWRKKRGELELLLKDMHRTAATIWGSALTPTDNHTIQRNAVNQTKAQELLKKSQQLRGIYVCAPAETTRLLHAEHTIWQAFSLVEAQSVLNK